MYKELIEPYTKENKYISIQNPASKEDIANAEKVVGYKFPYELVQLLSEMNGDKYLLLSTKEIIRNVELNRQYLSECYPNIDRHIFFAGNGCGDYYCYNVSDDGVVETDKLYIWEHEVDECKLVAHDIKELICRYYNNEI